MLAIALACLAAVAVVAVPVMEPAGATSGHRAQDPTSTTAADGEPDDGTPAPEGTDAGPAADPGGSEPTVTAGDIGGSRAPSTSTPVLGERVSESQAATTRLNRVVIALVVLAVIIAVATVAFWRATRPVGADRSDGPAMRWEVPRRDGDGGPVMRRGRDDAPTA